MKNFGLKVKLAATALAFAGMFAGSTAASAGVLTIGVVPINKSRYFETGDQFKTTADRCSDITLGDVTIYGSIQVTTRSLLSGDTFIQSNPWTVCNANSSTYLGQYTSIEVWAGQRIFLLAKPLEYASDPYTADIISWDFH